MLLAINVNCIVVFQECAFTAMIYSTFVRNCSVGPFCKLLGFIIKSLFILKPFCDKNRVLFEKNQKADTIMNSHHTFYVLGIETCLQN
jgi:hypothetical protein